MGASQLAGSACEELEPASGYGRRRASPASVRARRRSNVRHLGVKRLHIVECVGHCPPAGCALSYASVPPCNGNRDTSSAAAAASGGARTCERAKAPYAAQATHSTEQLTAIASLEGSELWRASIIRSGSDVSLWNLTAFFWGSLGSPNPPSAGRLLSWCSAPQRATTLNHGATLCALELERPHPFCPTPLGTPAYLFSR